MTLEERAQETDVEERRNTNTSRPNFRTEIEEDSSSDSDEIQDQINQLPAVPEKDEEAQEKKVQSLETIKQLLETDQKKEEEEKRKKQIKRDQKKLAHDNSISEDDSFDDEGNLIVPAWKKQGIKFLTKMMLMMLIHSVLGDLGIVTGILIKPLGDLLQKYETIGYVAFIFFLIFLGFTLVKKFYHNFIFAIFNFVMLTIAAAVCLASMACNLNRKNGLVVLIPHSVYTITLFALFVHCCLVKSNLSLFKSLMFILGSHAMVLSVYSMMLETYTRTMVLSSFFFTFVGLGINQNLMVILYGKRRVRQRDYVLMSQRMFIEVLLILSDPSNFTVELGEK